MFADIRSLPAAHLATFDFRSGKLSTPQCYWQLRQQPRNIAFPDAVAECRERFIENIRLHLRSDVPVGAALSGGIDSSAVVCVMRNLQPDLDLQTFSYISDDPAHSEERWVDLVHAKVGGVCHKIRPDPKDLAEDIELLVARQGEPFASASIYAQFRVFRAARAAGVPVTLDGQGADELLGGYWPHVGTRASQELLSGRVDNTLRLISNAAPGLSGKRLTASLLLQNLLSGKFRRAARRLAGRELFPNYFSQEWFESAGVDWRHLADEMLGRYRSLHEHLISNVTVGSLPNLLRYADRNSMAFAVESRVPFLTVDFAEFLMSLPARYLISPNGVRKYIFREAMKGILPEPIRTRQDKIGFFADDGTWLRRNAAQFADTWAELADEPLFDKNQFRRFVADFHAGRDNRALLAWRALVFGVWLRQSRRAVAASR